MIFFAATAGIISYLYHAINDQRPVVFWVALIRGLSSAVVGYITLLICQESGLSYEITGAVIGVTGWLGADVSIVLIESMIRKRLGIDDVTVFRPDRYKGKERREADRDHKDED